MALRHRVEQIDDEDVDVSEEAEAALASVARVIALHADRGVSFSPLERQVIALAREDTLASLEAPGVIERMIAFVFGLEAGRRRLADHKLEALRRAVVVTRHRHHLPDAIAAELGRIGYGAAQIRAIEALATEA